VEKKNFEAEEEYEGVRTIAEEVVQAEKTNTEKGGGEADEEERRRRQRREKKEIKMHIEIAIKKM
jgi:hypothetical protein